MAKEIFIKEIEQGSEVYIPREMNLNGFSASMKFYDPILIYMQNNMSDDQKELFYTT